MSETSLHPIVLLKGPRKKCQLRRLKKGRGKMPGQVENMLDRVRASVGDDNKILVPIIVHYKRKQAKIASSSSGLFRN